MSIEKVKQELKLAPVEGELLPVGKMPTVTAEQVNALAVIKDISKVEVLANAEETAAGIVKMKASYLPIIKKANQDLSKVVMQADFKRAQECRLSIRTERLDFTKVIDAELAKRKLFIKSADEGKKLVESAFKSLEEELDAAEKPVDERLKAAAAAKKALADAIAKLKAHTINPLLPAAEIEAAIDDFSLAFGDSDYGDSQDAAEAIFETKRAEFRVVFDAAVTREENERKIKEQEKQAQQRANINVTFPIAEISCYAARSSADIQSRIDLTAKVDMSAFELVLSEAETAKQSCLNMLAAFLPMAVMREAKEAADKAESERLERENQARFADEIMKEAAEKQYQDDWDLAIQEQIDRLAWEDKNIDSVITESAIIAIINDDAGVAEDVAKIIGESCVECVCDKGDCSATHHVVLDVIEVASDIMTDDVVMIPVKHLQALIYAAEQAAEHCGLDEDNDTIAAIEVAKSLI
jgi:hypothetical protein